MLRNSYFESSYELINFTINLIDFTYWFIDGEIFDGEDKSIEAWSFHVEIEDEEVFINIEPSDVNKLLVKYYKH